MTSFMNILGWFSNWNRITSQETTALTNIHPAKNLYDEAMQLSEEGHNKHIKASKLIELIKNGYHDALPSLIDFYHKHETVDELKKLLDNYNSYDIFQDPEFIFSIGKYLEKLNKDLYSDLIEELYSNAVELNEYSNSERVYELFEVLRKKHEKLRNSYEENTASIKDLKTQLLELNKKYTKEFLHLDDCEDYEGKRETVHSEGKTTYKHCTKCKDIIKQIKDKSNIMAEKNIKIDEEIQSSLNSIYKCLRTCILNDYKRYECFELYFYTYDKKDLTEDMQDDEMKHITHKYMIDKMLSEYYKQKGFIV